MQGDLSLARHPAPPQSPAGGNKRMRWLTFGGPPLFGLQRREGAHHRPHGCQDLGDSGRAGVPAGRWGTGLGRRGARLRLLQTRSFTGRAPAGPRPLRLRVRVLLLPSERPQPLPTEPAGCRTGWPSRSRCPPPVCRGSGSGSELSARPPARSAARRALSAPCAVPVQAARSGWHSGG